MPSASPGRTQEPKPDNHSDQTSVALKHLELCRQETIERLKIREQIVGGYTVAVVALFGYATNLKPSFDELIKSGNFQSLLVLLPLLAFAGAFGVAMHQEQIHAFALYIRSDLAKFLPAGSGEVPAFEHSAARASSTVRLIVTALIGQLVLFLGPWAYVAILYYKKYVAFVPMNETEQILKARDLPIIKIELFVGAAVIMLVAIRLIMACVIRWGHDKNIAELNHPKSSETASPQHKQ